MYTNKGMYKITLNKYTQREYIKRKYTALQRRSVSLKTTHAGGGQLCREAVELNKPVNSKS